MRTGYMKKSNAVRKEMLLVCLKGLEPPTS